MAEKGLNTLELKHALLTQSQTRSCLTGVYARNELMKMENTPHLVIVNTDPSWKPGEHWILLYFPGNGICEFFDSLGKELTYYHPDIEQFITKFCSKYIRVVNSRIQPVKSSLCGHYCLYYAYARCGGLRIRDIVNSMPSPHWIECCIPILFDVPRIRSDCQCCCSN